MTDQTIPPCPACGVVPIKHAKNDRILLCGCFEEYGAMMADAVSLQKYQLMCVDILGRACRELGIETEEQLKTRLDQNKNLLNNNEDLPMDNIVQIAKLCHEVNRAYCQAIGDNSQTSWDDAPLWQKESAIKGVQFHLDNPGSPPSASHESWLREKEATGWKYGPVKDAEKKEHPCFIPYEQLPAEQKAKDYIFKAAVEFAPMLAPDPRVAFLDSLINQAKSISSSARYAAPEIQHIIFERAMGLVTQLIAAQRGEVAND